MKAVILVRVSTDHQANSGLGVEAQRSACVAYAAKHDLEVIGEELELGVSGGLDLDQREGLLAAINTLGRGDVLLVAKRDRITRQMLVMAMVERMLEKRGARLASADGVANEDTPEAALMRSIITSFAVYERSLAKTRTKAALAAKRAQGKRYTRKPPFGFRFVDGLMVEHEDEQKALQMIHTLRSRGLTLSAISSELFAQGFTSRSGKAIGPGTLSKVLKRAA